MTQYHELLQFILDNGEDRLDRTGVGTKAVFGYQMRFDLQQGFPLLTTKKMYARGIIHELLWFLHGQTNIKYLVDNNVHIWDEWPFQNYLKATEQEDSFSLYSSKWSQAKQEFIQHIKDDPIFAQKWGELGPVYGAQWRAWQTPSGETIDQISQLLQGLKENPFSRRHIVTAWNPTDVPSMALPPCHSLFQCFVDTNNRLSLQLYQRSADVFLGIPFNIASYALLLHILSHLTGYQVGEFIHTLGDTHIYHNHFEQVQTQLSRTPQPLPSVTINPEKHTIDDLTFEDITIHDYHPYPAIKAPIAV